MESRWATCPDIALSRRQCLASDDGPVNNMMLQVAP